MTLHDRIMALKPISAKSQTSKIHFNNAKMRSAKLAKEADELMAEMAEALKEAIEWNWMDEIEPVPDHVELQVTDAMNKYNTYKERKQ